MRRDAGQVDAVEAHPPGARRMKTRDGIDHARFSGAIWSDQSMYLVSNHVQVNVVSSNNAAIADAEATNAEGGRMVRLGRAKTCVEGRVRHGAAVAFGWTR